MLRLRVDFLHVPNEMRPLSHGITAAFGVQLGVPLYTERNETAFGVLLDTERETGPLSQGITAVFGVHLCTERDKAVKSWNNVTSEAHHLPTDISRHRPVSGFL